MKLSRAFIKKIIRHESLYETSKYCYWTDYDVDSDIYTIYRCKKDAWLGGYYSLALNGGEAEEMTVPAGIMDE